MRKGIDLLSNDAKYIKKFIEKPSYELASSFLEDKKYLWNSGIFIAKAKVLISEIKNFLQKFIILAYRLSK